MPPRTLLERLPRKLDKKGVLNGDAVVKQGNKCRTDVKDGYDAAEDGQVDRDGFVQMPHKIDEAERKECNGAVEHEWKGTGDGMDTEAVQTLVSLVFI